MKENKHEVLKPYPYQEEGIAKILRMKRLIEGDEMGLGKTAQAIVAVERAKATPALVICPASLKINWEREIKKFTNLRPLILNDSVKSTFPYFIGDMNLYDVVITNFESLRKFFVVDAPKPYKLSTMIFQNVVKQLKSVIIDESARVKESSALSTKICAGICHNKEYIIALTGTPVVNNPTNLATQLAVIGRINDFEGGYGGFLDRYGGTGKNDPPRNLDELRRKITDTMFFRRSKTLVLKDLPDLTRSTVETELDPVTQEEYDTCQQDLIKYLTEYKSLTDKEAKSRQVKQGKKLDLAYLSYGTAHKKCSYESAVNGKSAVPESQYFNRIVLILLPLESNIVKPCAHKCAEKSCKYGVKGSVAADTEAFHSLKAIEKCQNKSGHNY